MKNLTLSLVTLAATALMTATARADGIFVAPKFVWDSHKDINEPEQKAIIVYGAGQEDLILQVKYEGPVQQFGWLIPVPSLPTVRAGSMDCFYELSKFTQKHLMEGEYTREDYAGTIGDDDSSQAAEPPVQVIETKTVGAYKIAVLSTQNAGALRDWLAQNHFDLPPDQSGVIESYVKQHWYFVAVKIDLSTWISSLLSISDKLASGELNPLQLSFASDRCVFPLKISSLSGKPSEVSLYVLASEPLLSQDMFNTQSAVDFSNDLVRAQASAKMMEQMRMKLQARREELGVPPPLGEENRETWIQQMTNRLEALPEETLEFAPADNVNLPECLQAIPRMAGRSWWISKDTYTFQPDEMSDLDFGPAMPVLAEMLGSKYGYLARADLAAAGSAAVPVLLTAIQSSNPVMRHSAALTLESPVFMDDPRIKAAAVSWLKNPEPMARTVAIDVLTDRSNLNSQTFDLLVPLLRDSDAHVREMASDTIAQAPGVKDRAAMFYQMLTDPDMNARIGALIVLYRAGLSVSDAEMLPFFKVPDRQTIGIVSAHFRDERGQYRLSDDQVVPLLQNTEPLARMIGLRILAQNGDTQALQLAKPLLDDPDPTVQRVATRVCNQLGGSGFMGLW